MRRFIKNLEQAGELARVTASVDPVLEMGEIADRIVKGGGRAILFENSGTRFPVLMNMFGSERRIAMALHRESIDEIPGQIETLFKKLTSPNGLGGKIALLGRAARWLPRRRRGRGKCQEIILKGDEARLGLLPALKCWPHDGGRFITLPLVATVDPDSGAPNLGMYRMQIFDEHTAGLHWHRHKTGERHYEAYRRRGERMPVSVCLGGDPAYTYAATAPMPDGMDEMLLAGFLCGRGVRLVRSVTSNIYVPADCDIVIEGYVDPSEAKVTEGPFGDHTGFYSLEGPYPAMHVTAITCRRDAVYPATIVGVPPQEDFFIGRATERIFLAPIRLALQPEVRDVWMPAAGVAHNLVVTAIDATWPGQAFKTAGALWGAGQMMFNKLMIVCAGDARDIGALARGVRDFLPEEDLLFSRGALDVLDHAASCTGEGGKMALDLTVSRPTREVVAPLHASPCCGVTSSDLSLAASWGIALLFAAPDAQVDAEGFAIRNGIEGVNLLVVTDAAAASLSHEELLWFCAANCEVGRDVRLAGGRLVVDARSKISGEVARWPNVATSSPETIALVDRRWAEYGLGGEIASPSLRYIPLLNSDGASV
ncbi:MAG: menaquinone biosynthesis decarboxylase [Rikenellaceae bacterium]|jgi:4-hydroxy-3-polyprenylbenzoate decarboxylase|nr:menaquinone biosynthesis decarboxylase [Rikenellaceae bacterium]